MNHYNLAHSLENGSKNSQIISKSGPTTTFIFGPIFFYCKLRRDLELLQKCIENFMTGALPSKGGPIFSFCKIPENQTHSAPPD